jgi:ATP-dependent DNA ligase
MGLRRKCDGWLLKDRDIGVLCTPPVLMVFDVLQVGRHDVRRLRLERRRTIMEDAIAGSDMVLPVRRLAGTGAAAWRTVEQGGLEGFVAKDPESLYNPSKRQRTDYRIDLSASDGQVHARRE